MMADLPSDRVMPDYPPFTRVGVDYFGPFMGKRGRSLVKKYGVIFICLAIRAVHIEVASSLDTSGGQSTQIKYLSKSTDTYSKILLQ